MDEFSLSSSSRSQVIDVTSQVEHIVRKSGVKDGLCLIHSLHTTTAIVLNEHESGLMSDILAKISRDFPRGAGWMHDRVDDNADSHLASIFLGQSILLPVRGGMLLRGTWQSILFVELDGPRGRRIIVEVLGE